MLADGYWCRRPVVVVGRAPFALSSEIEFEGLCIEYQWIGLVPGTGLDDNGCGEEGEGRKLLIISFTGWRKVGRQSTSGRCVPRVVSQ